jgi:hypothetical protein
MAAGLLRAGPGRQDATNAEGMAEEVRDQDDDGMPCRGETA